MNFVEQALDNWFDQDWSLFVNIDHLNRVSSYYFENYSYEETNVDYPLKNQEWERESTAKYNNLTNDVNRYRSCYFCSFSLCLPFGGISFLRARMNRSLIYWSVTRKREREKMFVHLHCTKLSSYVKLITMTREEFSHRDWREFWSTICDDFRRKRCYWEMNREDLRCWEISPVRFCFDDDRCDVVYLEEMNSMKNLMIQRNHPVRSGSMEMGYLQYED